MKKRLVALGLILAMTVSGSQLTGATTLQNARNQKSQAQSNLNSVNNKISQIEQEQESLQAEIDKLDAELVQILVDIDIIKGEIADKKVQLKKAESDLEVAQAKEAEQYDAMKKRIRYMYENGDTTFFTALFEADSFADVLNRVEFASKVYDADRTMLVEYQNTKMEVENLVTQVKEEKEDLEENQAAYQEEQKKLEKKKDSKKADMADFDSQLAQAESLASQYKATIDAQNEIIADQLAAAQREAARNVSAGASNVTSSNNSSSNSSNSDSSSNSSQNDDNDSDDKSEDKSDSDSGSSSDKSDSDSGSSSSSSKTGQAVANYACQFVGNPYKWGGSSLTHGADCSGFVMSVYAHFGKSLPHSSSALRGVGRGVSVSDMQPGDIVCYSGHVAIYIGGGRIVHASSPSTGIKISGNVHYKTILAVRRIF